MGRVLTARLLARATTSRQPIEVMAQAAVTAVLAPGSPAEDWVLDEHWTIIATDAGLTRPAQPGAA